MTPVGERRAPPCDCPDVHHEPKLIALTGGPGAGKTAVLEVVRRNFCAHVAVLPEAAGIVFGGGFRRTRGGVLLRAAQRAIYHVQRELERGALEQQRHATILCDRGTVDSIAYWPDAPEQFWADVASTRAQEMARYAAVIHLRCPVGEQGYDRSNPIRVESAQEAAAIDTRILAAWDGHPNRTLVPATEAFLQKLDAAIAAVRAAVPPCCGTPRLEPT